MNPQTPQPNQQIPRQPLPPQSQTPQISQTPPAQPSQPQQFQSQQLQPTQSPQPTPGQFQQSAQLGQQPEQQFQQQPQFQQPAQQSPQPLQQPKPTTTKKPQPVTNKTQSLSTQANLLISELRDGVVIMKDGSFRAVVACKSINFDLMSEAEREAVEYSYQNFINSLSFTTQILVRSQRIDIAPYLEQLSEIRRNTDNMLLGVLMDDYINFIDILSQEANIMDKSFFIVIPYYTSADAEKLVTQTKNFFKTFSKQKAPEVTKIDRNTYDQAITEINNRVDVVVSGLFQIGIHSVRLNTRELSELYYNFNNPDTAVREPYIDFSKMATTYVKKGEPNV